MTCLSTKIAIFAILAWNLASWLPELLLLRSAQSLCPALRSAWSKPYVILTHLLSLWPNIMHSYTRWRRKAGPTSQILQIFSKLF